MVGRLDLAAELRGERLHAVADAEDGRTGGQQRVADLRRARLAYRLGAAREDDALRRERRDLLGGRVERQDLAVDADFAHAPRDQLRVLATEVDDENALGVACVLGLRALAGFVIPRSGSSAVLW